MCDTVPLVAPGAGPCVIVTMIVPTSSNFSLGP